MDASNKQRMKPPSLNGTNVSAKKQELKNYFKQTWAEYEALFSLINDDKAYFLRPEPLRHPLIFYFGHTATFYINKLLLGKFISKRINSKLEAICAVGVDEMSWDDLNSAHYDWPSVNEVSAYRAQVARLITALIDDMELSLPIKQNSLAWVILMGCEHERIHIETSSVIMRMLPLKFLTPTPHWLTCTQSANAPTNTLIAMQGKQVEFGKPSSDDTFGWDNEYGHNSLNIPDFNVSKYLVSNQEYLAFVKAGGYQKTEFWTPEGQAWLAYSKATMPRFWRQKGNDTSKYWQRNLLNEMPLPLNWPVEVNYLEAKAFCQWKNTQNANKAASFIRLPTEAEWLCMRDKVAGDLCDWHSAPANINQEHYASSCPVDQFEHGGLFDVVGNVWQWTESSIDAFQGFDVHPLYDDFSTPTFDGKHNLIKGGSWISTGNEAQRHSRYAFRRHFFQHAGFRYVQANSEDIPNLATNPYESDALICQQLHANYSLNSNEKFNDNIFAKVKNYRQQIIEQLIDCVEKYQINTRKCLDLGCSVGRSSFMLAQHFEQVDAVDFSARYIQHCVNLQQGKAVRYLLENEGDIVDFHEVSLQEVDLPCSQNIHFSQGDVSNLKTVFKGYDVILAQHVLEQSYDPRLFLQTVQQRLNNKELTRQSLLIIVSNYDFNEQQSIKENWLGGIKVNGENVTGFDGLSNLLSPHFRLLEQHQLTCPIQINRRNFTVSFPQLNVWQLI